MAPLSSSQEDCSIFSLSPEIDAPISPPASPACSPQTRENARKHVRKTVSFNPRVRVRACHNRNSFSEQEMKSAFMTPNEFQRSKAQLLATVKKINNGSFEEDNEKDCKLGLERYSSFNRAVREELQFGALQSVLFEQELQQASNSSSIESSTRIPQVYKEYSRQAQTYAQLRALENTEEVMLEIGQQDYGETTTYVSLGNASFANLQQ
jgi:hypothetical protein